MTDHTNKIVTGLMVLGALMFIVASGANAAEVPDDTQIISQFEIRTANEQAEIAELIKREAALILELQQLREENK